MTIASSTTDTADRQLQRRHRRQADYPALPEGDRHHVGAESDQADLTAPRPADRRVSAPTTTNGLTRTPAPSWTLDRPSEAQAVLLGASDFEVAIMTVAVARRVGLVCARAATTM